ncbi:YetF domain-containing protein [Kribbella deserti]|uniref:YetF domain-containing protein n=1 Tax=Kribbella deserti TaxID=1926257 RepID=A0ABV6QF83_9ACTN
MWFHAWPELARVALVGVTAYGSLVLILRLSGKRTLSKLNAFDFVVTVALGSTLATILLSKDVSYTEGVLALAVLALMQLAVSWTGTRVPAIQRAVSAKGTLLLADGELLDDALKDQRVSSDQVCQAVRAAGLGSLGDVGAVVLETDGSLSVVPAGNIADASALRGLTASGLKLHEPRKDRPPDGSRPTSAVIEAHLHCRRSRDVESDLSCNYSHDVVLLSAEGVNRGHDGVRRLAGILHSYLDHNGEWSCVRLQIDGEIAVLQWRGTGPGLRIHDGVDTFVVRDGRIVAQTIHYSTRDGTPA